MMGMCRSVFNAVNVVSIRENLVVLVIFLLYLCYRWRNVA